MTDRRKPPIYTVVRQGTQTWTINIEHDERALILRLLGELREMLSGEPEAMPLPVAQRLFPPAFLDDPEKNAEYHRLMRDELIASRLAQIELVQEALGPDAPELLDEAHAVALMQSINAVRVTLGTLLDVGEDDDIDPGPADDPELHLYHYLSWLLEWTVTSLST